MKPRKQIAILWWTIAVVAAFAPLVEGHDFWIEPSTFRPSPGAEVSLYVKVGENFQGEPVKRNPEKIERFFLIEAGEARDITGTAEADPAGTAKSERVGAVLAAYRSQISRIELDGLKFEEYLIGEGLGKISKLRAQRGDTQKPAKEVYSRAAKALLCVGDAALVDADRPAGLTVEILPPADLCAATADGKELAFRITHLQKPWAGAVVMAMRQGAAQAVQTMESDGQGVVRFRFSEPGTWMVKTIHMSEAAPERNADWESIWATITFDIRPKK